MAATDRSCNIDNAEIFGVIPKSENVEGFQGNLLAGKETILMSTKFNEDSEYTHINILNNFLKYIILISCNSQSQLFWCPSTYTNYKQENCKWDTYLYL